MGFSKNKYELLHQDPSTGFNARYKLAAGHNAKRCLKDSCPRPFAGLAAQIYYKLLLA